MRIRSYHTSEGREEPTLVLLLFVFVLPKREKKDKRKRRDEKTVGSNEKVERMTNKLKTGSATPTAEAEMYVSSQTQHLLPNISFNSLQFIIQGAFRFIRKNNELYGAVIHHFDASVYARRQTRPPSQTAF